MTDLDTALQDLVEEYASRVHEHVELTLRSVENHCVVTRLFHPRDCRCKQQEEPDHAVSDAWLSLFERGEVTGL